MGSPDEQHGDLDSRRRPRLLLLCDYRPHEAATVIDHIEAIRMWSRNDVFVLPIYGDIPDELDLETFDGLVIHYNVVMSSRWYLSPLARWRISRYTGVKGAFVQDEYRFVNQTISVMRTLGIDVLFTCVPSDQVELVYPADVLPEMKRRITVLTGYVPDTLLAAPIIPYDRRPIDVGYRGRRLPPWLGELGQEKTVIADRFAADAPKYALAVDISCSEHDRIYGDAWIDFISTSKAVLGVESGASVFDFDGSIERSVRGYLAAYPGTTFEELRRRFFAEVDGRIRLNQISPRSFEAAALGTLMVLYPGDYSGILKPWEHYVPLAKNHSNMDQVVEAIRDPITWDRITRCAREEVALNPAYSYRAMVEIIDDGLDLRLTGRRTQPPESIHQLASRNFTAMPHTRLHAFGLPPAVNRARLGLAQAARLFRPNAIAMASWAGQENEKLHGIREMIRHAQAAAYWILQPRVIPWTDLLRGGRPLLEDLGELRRLQELGASARATGSAFPYVLLLDETAREVRLMMGLELSASADVIADVPVDLSWATTIRLHLSDPWLTPIDQSGACSMVLGALSAALVARPDVVGRLLAGPAPWCTVALSVRVST